MPKYDKAHFIAKFSAIPDDKWTTCGNFTDPMDSTKHCALGHCDPNADRFDNVPTEEFDAMSELIRHRPFGSYIGWPDINDGLHRAIAMLPQPTPKARVLAALNLLPD